MIVDIRTVGWCLGSLTRARSPPGWAGPAPRETRGYYRPAHSQSAVNTAQTRRARLRIRSNVTQDGSIWVASGVGRAGNILDRGWDQRGIWTADRTGQMKIAPDQQTWTERGNPCRREIPFPEEMRSPKMRNLLSPPAVGAIRPAVAVRSWRFRAARPRPCGAVRCLAARHKPSLCDVCLTPRQTAARLRLGHSFR